MRNATFKISAVFIALSFAAVSCKKDKICHGSVHTTDSSNNAVADVNIKLYADGGDVIYEGTTDGSGTATFEVKLPAIFDIAATKAAGNLTGSGVLRLDEAGKSNEVTVLVH